MDDGMERAVESERLHHSFVRKDEVVLIPTPLEGVALDGDLFAFDCWSNDDV